ncbi:MAG: transporter substrate-binding domain-containing protein [Fermentimonas sp.]|nr:transporter substrate-binding domain-containing protein [Fermentimonas sp.]
MIMLRNSLTRKTNIREINDYNEIIERGEMNVVTDYNAIGHFISGDTVQGFQYELINALKEEWGIHINIFLENNLQDNLNGLQEGKYDIVARSIPVNSELKGSFSFTEPLILNKLVLVQRKTQYNDSIEPLRQHLELAKKTIHVSEGSPSIFRLNNLSHEIGDTIFVVQNTTYEAEQLVMMVASGEIEYTVCDEKVALQLSEELPEIDIETDISFTQIESWAVRIDSPILLDSVNSWLTRFKETHEFKNLIEKYY